MLINLWPDGQLPGTCDHEDSKEVEELTPHILWKQADSYEEGDELPTVLIIPGGGYSHRADRKKEFIAEWLNEHGFHAAVLRYRVSPWRYPTPQFDAIRAMRVLRHQAESLGIDSGRIVVLGASAGGHLAASLALLHDAIPAQLVMKSTMRIRGQTIWPHLSSNISHRSLSPRVMAESTWPQGILEATRRRESGKMGRPRMSANVFDS